MANKTIKIFGNGYAPTGQSASVTVIFNGNTVYTGTVPTLSSTVIEVEPADQVEIFSFEVDDTYYGNSAVSIQATAGDQVTASWAEVNSAVDPTDFQSMYQTNINRDYRTDVELDGVPQSKGPLGEILQGAWLWTIPNGSTLSFNMIITPGGEIPAWDNATSYKTNDYVLSGSTVYRALANVASGTPVSNTGSWTVAGTWNS